MKDFSNYEFWFITGSQHLYGNDVLKKVADDSQIIVDTFNNENLPFKLICKPVVTTPEAIEKICNDANCCSKCVGIITWMHTFSPAKMWIHGLSDLRKPLLHLHTQFNRDIPWSTIDMNFMNLNQSAHGDREFGYLANRVLGPHKVLVGHYKDKELISDISKWMNTAMGYIVGRHIKIARFGDNMRDVAVTDGDRIEAQIKFGWQVDYYAVGDLVKYIDSVTEEEIDSIMDIYKNEYIIADSISLESIRVQGAIEIGLKKFLDDGGYTAFSTNFQDLYGLKQLPGLAVQRLLAQGYGFGAEGDWKTAALVRTMKVMCQDKGTSFMEDYTYNLDPENPLILESHMLEVCPSLAANKPEIKVYPLSMGNKEDPARLVFKGASGHGVVASLIDLGNRFRLIVNEGDAVECEHDMHNLPVASLLWKPEPSLKVSAQSWILAGGAHHTAFSFGVDAEQLMDWCEMMKIECILINKNTTIPELKKELLYGNSTWI